MLNYISRKAAINNIIPGKFVDRFPDGGRRRGGKKKKEISATFVAREEKGKRPLLLGAETSGSGRKQRRDRGKRRVHRWGNTGNATAVPTGIGVAGRD